MDSLCPPAPGPHCSLLSSAVHSGLCGPGAEHPAHAHLRLDPRLRGKPLQVLPASHLHAHPAGALRRHPGQSPPPPALLKPQTLQDPEGLGEGQRCQIHAACGPRPGPEDEPLVRACSWLRTPAPAGQRLRLSGLLSVWRNCTNRLVEAQIPGTQMYVVIFRMTFTCE